jgi:hypothetical protein
MMSPSLSKALDFIRANQNSDGGWGYRPRCQSFTEPTGFCALALFSGGDKTAAGRALDFLKACQKDNGAISLDPKDTEGSWMAYAALLAFHALGAASEERRLKDWILSFKDASDRFTPADIKAIAATLHYDASIPGWPWTPNTTAWVEPTALFLIALIRAGTPLTQDRIRSGISLILDRKVRSGGWNFGNPASMSHKLEASLMSTAIALAALAAAGYPENRPPVEDGLRFLGRCLAGEVSTASLGWCLLVLKSFSSEASRVQGIAARLAGLQAADGSFRRNLFETALAFLVLVDPGALLRIPGRNG